MPSGTFGLDCQRYGSYPQIDPPGAGPVLPLHALPAIDGNHVRQLKGLHDLARDMGFWIGPVVFPTGA